jgi:SAM-dependent methyltransferase
VQQTVELLDLVSAYVPPGARLLEVGCGEGRLALALAGAGYDVTAIDPRAPSGEIFRQVMLEEFHADAPFDAVAARWSLHHVHDLPAAFDRIRSLLRPGGPFVIGEYGWDLMDEPTVRWYSRVSGADSHTLADWRAEHDDLHGHAEIARELEPRFRQRTFAWTPYVAKMLERPELEPEEIELIEAGKIRALGFEYVGERI